MSYFEIFFGSKSEEPNIKINHPKLGKLYFRDEGWWKGKTKINELKIEFYIDGNEDAPNEIFVEDCLEILENFEEYKQKALNLLERQKNAWNIKQELEFTPTGLWNFFRKGKNKGFTMSFLEKTKPDFFWRVEFENTIAKNAGFDS